MQQAQAKIRQELELTNNMRQFYENMSYEDDETKEEPHANATKATVYAEGPPPSVKHKQEEKIDHFWAPRTKRTIIKLWWVNKYLDNKHNWKRTSNSKKKKWEGVFHSIGNH